MRVTDLQFDRSESFDLEVAVCGYETRAVYISSVKTGTAETSLAIDYQSSGLGAYDDNLRELQDRRWHLASEESVLQQLRSAGLDGARIRVDISSMRRATIARIVEGFCELGRPVAVQFVYAPPKYESSAQVANMTFALSAGPVTPYFSGTLRPSSIPLGLVAGLGLEPHRVLGLAELLEPSQIWAFIAENDDQRFAESVRDVQQSILAEPHTLLIPYDVRSPAETYSSLESLTFAAGESHRLVLAPSGPKIFALMCLLAAVPPNANRPAVWRVGGQGPSGILDVEAAGDVVAAEVSFVPKGDRQVA